MKAIKAKIKVSGKLSNEDTIIASKASKQSRMPGMNTDKKVASSKESSGKRPVHIIMKRQRVAESAHGLV